MSRFTALLCLLIFCSLPFAHAQHKSTYYYEQAMSFLSSRGEVYLEIPLSSAIDPQQIGSFVSIDEIRKGSIMAYANMRGFNELVRQNIPFMVHEPPSSGINPGMSSGGFPGLWDVYPYFDEYISMMHSFASDYPSLCLLDTIGFSLEGRELLVVKISDNVKMNEAEPDFLYTSTIHGDEPVGYVLLLRLIDQLLKKYGSDPEITWMIDHMQIWINPLANPDGLYWLTNDDISDAKRFNANSIDLNRNFPDPEEGEHPDGNPWQPETEAMMTFMKELHLVLSANIHTGAELVNYPWDTWPEYHADDNWYMYISRQYADTVYAHSSDYFTQKDNGITNGYAWYSISGGRQDYVNYFLNAREVTLELSADKFPPAQTLPAFWEYNYRSLLKYMSQCLYGISGKVSDNNTGLPVVAKIDIMDHDFRNSYVLSDGITGSYFRMIKEGIYDIRFTAEGYRDTVVENVLVYDNSLNEVNVAFLTAYSAFPDAQERLRTGPSPFNNELWIYYEAEDDREIRMVLSDPAGHTIFSSGNMALTPGENQFVIKVSHASPGIYILKIITDSCSMERKVIKVE